MVRIGRWQPSINSLCALFLGVFMKIFKQILCLILTSILFTSLALAMFKDLPEPEKKDVQILKKDAALLIAGLKE